jgi:hypothetical protein
VVGLGLRRLALLEALERVHQLVEIGGFRKVRIEPCLARPLSIFRLRVPAQRHEPCAPERLGAPKRSSDLEAVHVGQADVAKDDVRLELPRKGDPRSTVTSDAHLVTMQFQDLGEALRPVRVSSISKIVFGATLVVACRAVSGFESATTRGKRTRNSEPRPGPSLRALTVPRWSSTMLFTSASPSPRPPFVRASA